MALLPPNGVAFFLLLWLPGWGHRIAVMDTGLNSLSVLILGESLQPCQLCAFHNRPLPCGGGALYSWFLSICIRRGFGALVMLLCQSRPFVAFLLMLLMCNVTLSSNVEPPALQLSPTWI